MNQNKKTARALAFCMAGVLCGTSMDAVAQRKLEIVDILPQEGISRVFSRSLDADSYMEAARLAEGAYWGYTNLGMAAVEEGNLNIRENPDVSSKLVGKMSGGAACEVLEVTEDGQWAHIKSGDVEGYVSTSYIYTGADAIMYAYEKERTVATVNVNGLRIREEANETSKVVHSTSKGEELEVLELLEGWVKVAVDNMEAYVSAQYVTVEDKLDTAQSMTQLKYGQGVSDVRVDLVEYALQFVGNPYVWGGTSLTKGADCSGFVLSVFKKYGIKMPRHSGDQAKKGTKISESDLKPGDLVFYSNSSGTINHVAIYIGNGQVVHASSPKTGIKISKYKYRTPSKYVRILED